MKYFKLETRSTFFAFLLAWRLDVAKVEPGGRVVDGGVRWAEVVDRERGEAADGWKNNNKGFKF